MSTKIYVLNQRQEETFDAAGKAMRDVFSVLTDKGAKIIWSMPKNCSKVVKILDLPYLVLFLLLRVGKRQFVFYSIPENQMKIRILKKVQRIKKFRILCFINDLNAFRYESIEGGDITDETKHELLSISVADEILVPNKNTKRMLVKAGITANLIPVGVWDYLMSQEQVTSMQRIQKEMYSNKAESVTIAFAGNLNKSEFLSVMDIPEGISMELWGKLEKEKQDQLPSRCCYHGILSSEEIPLAICTMNYGLVWDGVGRDDIEGGLGEYLRYNNSHKCALYLASGIPVIVWSKSGMASFVKENQCGIMIERLSDLEEKIRAADYQTLKAHAMKTAHRLQQGYYLKRAIDAALES